MNRDPSYLLDIYQYGQDVVEFVQGMDATSFATDVVTQRAVIYSITIMGEATKKLSAELRAQNPQIPWRQLAGMRDKCVHDYRQIDTVFVWQVAQTSIPALLQAIEPLLPTED
ncbi:MAG: DUF86 domain-containing protein [Cyanobacteria bacterium P01_F01_bin.56]